MGMFARRLLLTAALLAACGDDSPAVERDPNPAQAADAANGRDDTGVPTLDASGLPIGRGDGAVIDASAGDSSRGTPNVVPYPACGGVAGLRCPEGEFCSHEMAPDGLGCGWEDSLGTCKLKLETCTETERVCGCDGESYESRCEAHAAGVPVKVLGPCKTDRALNCDERDVLCKRARPDCPEGQVPSVVESCWGECVGISDCVCHAADECPQREQYVCHMSAQHCGPYVN